MRTVQIPVGGWMRMVPRLNVWVTCPRCGGAAHVVEKGVLCTACTWSATGASGRSSRFCHECQQVEGDGPYPLTPVASALRWRCPSCGRREREERELAARSRPGRHCPCGARMVLESWRPQASPAHGHDPLYALPYYLRRPCKGHELWIANVEHGEYLRDHISARLRRRPVDFRLRTLGQRLPAWMLSAKNRDAVLHALEPLLEQGRALDEARR